MNALSLINVTEDEAIIQTAFKDALEIINTDPELANKENSLLRFEISRMF